MKRNSLTVEQAARYISTALLKEGVVIQFYAAYSTSSLYMKFDCGLANSLRIGDHKGKKHLNYMFLVDIYHQGKRKVVKRKFTQYVYSSEPEQLDKLIAHILEHREQKIMSYFGDQFYREAMKQQYAENKGQKGFWNQAKFIRQGLYT